MSNVSKAVYNVLLSEATACYENKQSNVKLFNQENNEN